MSRNQKRNNVRRKRRSSRRRRQVPLHIPSVQIQPWRRITLVLQSTGLGTYEAFSIKNIRRTLASQTTLTIDKDHPYLLKFLRIRVWNRGHNSTLGPVGLMPFTLLDASESREPLFTFEDHPVGMNPARTQFTWPRLHQQVIFHTGEDKKKRIFGVLSNIGDELVLHLAIVYKPVSAVDFITHSGLAQTGALRDTEVY